MSMCFDLFSVTGLEAIKIEPWLSPQIGTGWSSYPNSPRIVCTQTTCLLQSDSAMYSASVDERAIVFWAQDVQEMGPPANLRKNPVWERQLLVSAAQSESVVADRP